MPTPLNSPRNWLSSRFSVSLSQNTVRVVQAVQHHEHGQVGVLVVVQVLPLAQRRARASDRAARMSSRVHSLAFFRFTSTRRQRLVQPVVQALDGRRHQLARLGPP